MQVRGELRTVFPANGNNATYKSYLRSDKAYLTPFPLTTTIPMSDPFDPLRSLTHILATNAHDILSECTGLARTPEGVRLLIARRMNAPLTELGNRSVVEVFSLDPSLSSNAPPTAPSLPQEELRLLRTSFDTAFTSLAGQVKELSDKVNGSGPPPKAATAKKPSAQPTSKPRAQPPTAPTPTPASRPAPPSFASMVKAPARPSLVVALRPPTPGADVPLAVRRTPQEVVTHLNAKLADSPHMVALSAARWTAKNNLVVTAGPDTLVHQLMQASHLISDVLSTFLSHNSSPLPITSHENVKWSRLLINGIPTGVSSFRRPYSPSECHQALMADNPAFRTLRFTQPPSWVRAPSTYGPGSISSLVVAFEDPSGDSLRSLLGGKTLFAFRHSGELRCWKQKPRGKAATPASG